MDHLYPTGTSSNPTNMNISFNLGDYFDLSKQEFSYLIAILVTHAISTAASLFGILTNGIVIWYLTCCIPRNSFTVYILNLAIADFVFLLLFFSFQILIYFKHEEMHMFIFLKILDTCLVFGYAISQYLLTAISVERCVSVLFPLWYRCKRPKHQSAIVCVVLWAFVFLIQASDYATCLAYDTCEKFITFQPLVICLVFLPLMLLSNVFLIIKICRSSQRRQPLRMYSLIIATVFAFVLFSVPMSISFLLVYFDTSMYIYILIPTSLPVINSSLNPVIYFLAGSLRSGQRKCSIVAALKRAFADKSEQWTASHNVLSNSIND